MITALRIDRLSLDLRGVDPATAEAAVRLLGPALQAHIARTAAQTAARSDAPQLPRNSAARDHIDAGRVAACSDPQALADRLAERVFQSAGHGLQPPARKG